MAEYAEDGFMMRSEKKKKKKKKKRAELDMAMKQIVVQCSIHPHDAASFPPLAVARKLIHTHTSSPFPHACSHLPQERHRCLCFLATAAQPGVAVPFSPSPPPLIINHTCPTASPLTLQQQVLLRDAVPSPTIAAPVPPCCHTEKQPCRIKDSTDVDTDSTRHPFALPSFVESEQAASTSKDGTLQSSSMSLHPRISPDGSLLTTSEHVEKTVHGPSRHSILSSLLAAAEDGAILAAELLHHFKESLLSVLPQSIRNKVSDDWNSILSSRVIEQYMDKMNISSHSQALWVSDTTNFKRVILKVSKIKLPRSCYRHSSIEDLLQAIESFEKAGLIDEIQSLGYVDEACVLRDRLIFYGLFARLRVLQEVSKLLHYMRLEMCLPLQDTWSLACSDARYRNCMKQICTLSGFCDKIKTFAWKLDKLELCANEANACKMDEGDNVTCIDNRLTKLLESPLGFELEGLRVISYLDTAVSLLLHHIDVFKSLHEHGFGEP